MCECEFGCTVQFRLVRYFSLVLDGMMRTYDEPSELVDMEWRLPARLADDDGATSTDL